MVPGWRDHRRRFDGCLGALKSDIGNSLDTDPSIAYAALERFARRVDSIAAELIPAYDELASMLKERVLPRSTEEQPALVEVLGWGQNFFPLEWLPIRFVEPAPSLVDRDDVKRALRSFLGGAVIVHRRFAQEMDPSVVLGRGKLGVRLFRHAGLSGAEKELAFLQKRGEINLCGVWPGEHCEDAAQELAELSHGGAAADPPEAVHHFACHFAVDKAEPVNSVLSFSGSTSPASPRKVVVDNLSYRLKGLHQGAPIAGRGPLVFMNACGSSEVTSFGEGVLPVMFRRYGSAGFIGTQTNVPDAFAAPFSCTFYEILADGDGSGVGVGLALHRARTWAVEYAANPLGLLYIFYGNPDLSITKETP